MTGPRPTCTRTEQAVGWALHALEPDEEIAVERHVPTCPDCSAAVRDAQVVMAQLATAVEQVEPPARLRASILDAAAATPQVRPRPRRSRRPHPGPASRARPVRRVQPVRPLAVRARLVRSPPAAAGASPPAVLSAAVAALAIVAAGGLGIRTVQLQQQTVELQQQLDTASSQVSSTTALVQDLSRPGNSHALLAKPDGTAVAAVVLAGDQRTVYTISLAANSADQTYVLWGLKDAAAAPEPLGVFDVDECGHPANRRPSRGAAVRRVRDLP